MKDALVHNNGRISLEDLNTQLQVSSDVIHNTAVEVMREVPTTHLISRVLVTRGYLDSLLVMINSRLQSVGYLTLREIYQEWNLPIDYLQKLIEDNAQSMECFFDTPNGHGWSYMYTRMYMAEISNRIRESLCFATAPTTLKSILDLVPTAPVIFQDAFRSLLDSGAVAGSVKGGVSATGIYVPSVFVETQSKWVAQSFSQNGYLDFKQLSSMQIDNPVVHTISLPGQVLVNSFVGLGVLARVDGVCEEMLKEYGCCNITLHVPPSFSEEDVAAMIPHLDQCQSHIVDIILNHIVVDKQLPKRCVEFFDEFLEKRARENRSKSTVRPREVSSNRKSARAGRQRSLLSSVDSILEDEEVFAIVRSRLDERNVEDDVVQYVCQAIFPMLQERYNEVAGAWKADALETDMENDIFTKFKLIQLYAKGVRNISGDTTRLQTHLLRSVGSEIMMLMKEFIMKRFRLTGHATESFLPSALPEPTRKHHQHMQDAINQGDLSAFLMHASDMIDVENVLGSEDNQDDDVLEKRILDAEWSTNIAALREATVHASILHLVVFLIYQQATGCILSAPGRCVPQIITSLKDLVSSDVYRKLVRFQKLVLKLATARKTCDEMSERTIMEDLNQRSAGIRRLVIDPTNV
eukprot:CFRG7703T1